MSVAMEPNQTRISAGASTGDGRAMSTSYVRLRLQSARATENGGAGNLHLLDRVIRLSQRLRICNVQYHPYFLFSDIGAASILVLSCYLSRSLGESGIRLLALMLVLMATYEVFVLLRSRIMGLRARSYLQDLIVFIIPTFYVLVLVFGVNKAAAFDLLGVSLPLYVGFCRIGCFLGGCCYGLPCRFGVLYPEQVFSRVGGCRVYSPGSYPSARVFPIQLLEAAVQFGLFIVLEGWVSTRSVPRGEILFVYLGL